VEGCRLFVTYQWGNPQAPIYRGNAEGAKLPHGYVAEKTSPGAPELKKSPSSFDKRGVLQRSHNMARDVKAMAIRIVARKDQCNDKDRKFKKNYF
jgi:hypothetical protein